MNKGILVDIDDCILNVTRRKAAIYSYLLNKKITVKDVIGKRTAEFLSNYLPPNKIEEYREKFWKIALCLEKEGYKFIDLDKPEPYSRQILRKLSKKFIIVYISNRLESMKHISISQLKKFNFPYYENVYHADDQTFLSSTTEGRKSVLSKIPKLNYVVVIDDLPENYYHYKNLGIPKIIGFMKYIVLDEKKFYNNGANYVIKSWKDFPLNDFL
jgi:hypothetical protein